MQDNEKNFELLHEWFQSEAWLIIKDKLEETEQALNDLGSVSNEQQLYFNKGRVFELRQYLALPEQVRVALEENDAS